jgi:hypothetical protein
VISAHIEIILIVTGAATAIALIQFIAPSSVFRVICGAVPADMVSIALARHWGLLIFLIEILLIYAAFHPSIRDPAMAVAAVEKLALGAGVFGTSLRSQPVATAIATGDSLIALIYLLYLVGGAKSPTGEGRQCGSHDRPRPQYLQIADDFVHCASRSGPEQMQQRQYWARAALALRRTMRQVGAAGNGCNS